MSLLKGKVSIVTGGSRGIGKAIAEVFARLGANVVICGRHQPALDAVAAELSQMPGKIIPMACDVGRPEQVEGLVDATLRDLGRIDILVNNAATNIVHGPCVHMDDGQFDKMIEINLKSAYRFMRLVSPGMCERGSGSIINIASVSGIKPQHFAMLYSVTKAALIMLTKSYALELGQFGVRVNAIAPGLVETASSRYYWRDEHGGEPLIDRQPIQRAGTPAEIAEVAVMLASDRGSFITGQIFAVDGGISVT
ncbi:MAG: SDR family oxidoreductase [Bryobacterales bacterium]|nr:SDR family oxidoreductase [Bryobacterales bacterium]